jgi:tetratricopeptide (TPR) repeat protein
MVKKFIFSVSVFLSVFLSFSQDWKVKLERARNFYKAENFPASYQQYLEAKKLAPESIDFSNEMGQAAYKSGNFKESIDHFNAFTENPKNNKVGANDYHNLGNSYMRSKNYEQAIDSYKKALRKNPTDKETRYNLSEALRKNSNNDQNNQSNNNPPPPQSDKKKKPDQPKENKNSNSGNLPKRAVDRMLDKLSKNEADTKKKINNKNNKGQGSSSTGKDW